MVGLRLDWRGDAILSIVEHPREQMVNILALCTRLLSRYAEHNADSNRLDRLFYLLAGLTTHDIKLKCAMHKSLFHRRSHKVLNLKTSML